MPLEIFDASNNVIRHNLKRKSNLQNSICGRHSDSTYRLSNNDIYNIGLVHSERNAVGELTKHMQHASKRNILEETFHVPQPTKNIIHHSSNI